MNEKLETVNQIDKLAEALAKAQGELENAGKNAANPHFKNRYADLAEVLNTIRPIFSRHGLSVTQLPGYANGEVYVETRLMHSSGQHISSVLSAPVSKPDAQGIGSAITYCRRYALAAIAGISQEDDDAEGAVGRGKQQAAPAKEVALDQETVATLDAAKTIEELADAWNLIPVGLRKQYAGKKDEAKARIMAEVQP